MRDNLVFELLTVVVPQRISSAASTVSFQNARKAWIYRCLRRFAARLFESLGASSLPAITDT